MKLEIYADMVFIVNFIMDFFVLWLAGRLLHKKVPLSRLAFAAVVGAALYCAVMLMMQYNKINHLLAAIVVEGASIFICFKPKKPVQLIKQAAVVNICAFFAGGTATAVFYYIHSYSFGGIARTFSFKLLLCSTLLVYIILKLFMSGYEKAALNKQTFCCVRLCRKNAQLELNALVDTGNSLHEPFSSKPVIVAEYAAVKQLLPESMSNLFNNGEQDMKGLLEGISNASDINGLRLIPFSSLGRENGMLIGFKVDRAEIFSENTIVIKDAVIAVYNFKLSDNGCYNALLNPELLYM